MKAKKLKEERINEAIGILFLLVGIYTFVALLFYHPSDSAFYTSHPNRPFRNVTGVIGAQWSYLLHFSLGWSSYSIPVLFLFWASCFFLQKVPSKKWVEFAGIAIAIAACATLFSLFVQESWKVSAGGVVGYFAASNLTKYFGVAGAFFISVSCLGIALLVATDFLIYPWLERLWKWGMESAEQANFSLNAKKTFVKLPKPIVKNNFKEKLAVSDGPKVKKYKEESPPASSRLEPKDLEAEASLLKQISARIPVIKKEIKKQPAEEVSISMPVNELAANYRLPGIDLLTIPQGKKAAIQDDLQGNARILEETLRDFGIEVKVTEIEQGPVITRYEVLPAPGVKVNRIVSLGDDLALALKSTSVHFLAPIPGKAAVGIEIPNSSTATVYLKEVLDSREFREKKYELPLLLGKDTSGKPLVADLTEMPHLLIAGATGSGKTVCVNSLIAGLIFNKLPTELKFVMVDPKMVEMAVYKDVPHMLAPVVTDVRKAGATLNWLVAEMEKRYRIFATCATRNIQAFNQRASKEIKETSDGVPIPNRLPYIVLIIDELADLMAVAQDKVESAITRLAQLSRAVGIHLILATQRPSVDVITGVIKANFPARISFKVASKVDSRTVLDINGADKLLGKGDMMFLKPGEPKPIRGQSTYISDEEINKAVHFIKTQQGPQYLSELEQIHKGGPSVHVADKDELYDEAVRVVLETRQASVSVLQRKLRLGYGRAARIIDMMEQEGVVGPFQGARPREILVDKIDPVAESSAQESSA